MLRESYKIAVILLNIELYCARTDRCQSVCLRMPPPPHRKKPFSVKQKKKQLQERREERRDWDGDDEGILITPVNWLMSLVLKLSEYHEIHSLYAMN